MTSSSARAALPALLILVLAVSATPLAAASLQVGGELGFGITANRLPGAFRWDFDSAHEDTSIAVLKLGARAGAMRAFVAVGARLADEPGGRTPRFDLREASLVAAWRRASIPSDTLAARLFARQPQSLWVEHALTLPVAPALPGAEDVLGARADATFDRTTATLLVASFGAALAREPDPPVAPPTVPADAALLFRVRQDFPRWGATRIGGSWKRFLPDDLFAGRTDARRIDVLSADLRTGWKSVYASLEFAHAYEEDGVPSAPAIAGAGRRSAGPVTHALSEASALRAEIRTRGLPIGRAGSLGFAPRYRALGGEHVDRLVDAERAPGQPRRGLEGGALEAWFELGAWPAWLRAVYDRQQEFRDVDRRRIAQLLEAQAWASSRLRARAWYVQRDIRRDADGVREHHDDLLAEIVVEEAQSRLRAQAGVVDLDGQGGRTVGVIEAAAHLGSRVQALARTSFASAPAASRRSFFAELQYWHWPQFELALAWGPDWIGDAADPVLDGDLTADGDAQDRVRLHFRGWF